mgnify:CR=1 FL=1
MNARNPMNFFETDFTKVMADFKMPGVDMDNVINSQRRNIDALTQANRLAFEGMQTVMRRQQEVLQTMLAEMQGCMNELMTQSAPEEKVAKQTELLQQNFEKLLENMREMTELMAKSNNECADVLSKRFSESLAELKSQVESLKQ